MQKMMPVTMGSHRPSSTPPKVRVRGPLSWLVYVSLTGIGCFAVSILALHWLQPGLDPLDEAMSYYVHGAHGWLLTVGLLALGLSSLALTAGLARTIDGPEARAGQWCLVVWGV